MAEYKGELFDEMPTGAGRGRINPVAPMEKFTPETLASPEGKALIARQNEQMAATPEPNAVAATREIAPVAANIVKDNAVEGFNTLTPGEAKVAGGLGAAGLEYAIYRSLRDKIDKNPPTSVTPASPSNKPFIDPTFTDTFGSDQPVNKLDALRKLHNIEAPQTIETAPVFTPEEHRLQRQQIAINQARQELTGATPTIQTPPVTPEVPAAPAAPESPKNLPTGPQTKPVVPPEAPTGPLMTGTGKPAFAGEAPPSEKKQRFKKEYASIKEVPQGYAFIPGGQSIDTARNDLGQETYTKEFSKRDFPKNPTEATEISKEINRSLNRPTRAEIIEKGLEFAKPTPGITLKASGVKTVKLAGIAGALVALSDISKAAEKGKYPEAAAQTVDLATDFLPYVGTAKNALMGMGLNPNEEEQLKQLQYRQKVGYGRGTQGSTGGGQGFRGIAPPTR